MSIPELLFSALRRIIGIHDRFTMAEFLMALWPYVPLILFVAAFLDVLCFTGLFIYGGAMVGGVLAFYLSGAVTVPEIVVSSTIGTLAGSSVNFYLGRYLGHHPRIKVFLEKPRAKKLTHFLTTKPLWLVILIGRFITLARPLYGLALGAAGTSPKKFFMYEVPIVIFWVALWLFILIQGEMIVSEWLMLM